jgi:hypothetical protein
LDEVNLNSNGNNPEGKTESGVKMQEISNVQKMNNSFMKNE